MPSYRTLYTLRGLLSVRLYLIIFFLVYFYCLIINKTSLDEQSAAFLKIVNQASDECPASPSVDAFVQAYQPYTQLGQTVDLARVDPTIERIRTLLQIVRSKEDQYQSLLSMFDVFDMANASQTFIPYGVNQPNIDEIKLLYHRYIKLTADKTTMTVDDKLLNYLLKISSYLSDGLKHQRTNTVSETLKMNSFKFFLYKYIYSIYFLLLYISFQ
jgi:hypothetical protein